MPAAQPIEYIYKENTISYFLYSFVAVVASFFAFYSFFAVIFDPFYIEVVALFLFFLHWLCWLVWILNKKEYLFEGNIYLRCSSHLVSAVLILVVFHEYWEFAVVPAVIHLVHYVFLTVLRWMMPWRRENASHVVDLNPAAIYYTAV